MPPDSRNDRSRRTSQLHGIRRRGEAAGTPTHKKPLFNAPSSKRRGEREPR